MRKIFSLILAAAALTSCVTTPGSDRRQLILVSEGQMHQMGEQAYGQMKEETPISDDEELKRKVTEIGRRIAKASGAEYDWEFTVFESEQANAFCLPGGKIGVYTGILDPAKTNAGLAAILGHEIAHATARHGAERVSQALVVQGVMIGVDKAMGDTAHRPKILAALGLGAQVGVMLPFSRKHEREADMIGLRYMAKAGYDPAEAVELWKRMSERGGGAPPEFLSTHPHSDSRVEYLRESLDEVRPLYEKSDPRPTKAIF